MELLLLIAGSLFSGDTFYEGDPSWQERLYELAAALSQKDPRYVGALAQYARQVLGLRSGPSALVAHLFWWGPREVAEEAAQGVWLRGDEHLETLAYTRAQGWKIRKALKRAVAKRLNAMSPRALLKYQRKGRSFSQRDALILSHPKPQDEAHALVYEWLVRGKRGLPEAQTFVAQVLEERPTWERILSAKGASRESWLEALPHLRGLSLLRNLNNLHLPMAPGHLHGAEGGVAGEGARALGGRPRELPPSFAPGRGDPNARGHIGVHVQRPLRA
jgi:hypothetical protein